MRETDYEWVELMLDARRLGLTTEEIREFLLGAVEEKEEVFIK